MRQHTTRATVNTESSILPYRLLRGRVSLIGHLYGPTVRLTACSSVICTVYTRDTLDDRKNWAPSVSISAVTVTSVIRVS